MGDLSDSAPSVLEGFIRKTDLARQLNRSVRMLASVLDPLAGSLANAPIEDKPISEEETRAVPASRAWLKNHQPIPREDVLAAFGLTSEDFERMGRSPLDPHSKGR